MTDSFVINYINNKLAETSDINYIRYTFYELRVKNNLSEKDLDKFLEINKKAKILLSVVYLSFSGLSIHTQIKSILPDTNYKLFLKNRIYSIIISILLLILFHSMKLL